MFFSIPLSPSAQDVLVRRARLPRAATARRHCHLDRTDRHWGHLPLAGDYHTHPGSRLLFPTLCEPTGTLVLPEPTGPIGDRGVMMPKRRRTRAQDRAYRIAAERRLNDAYVAERNRPPPF